MNIETVIKSAVRKALSDKYQLADMVDNIMDNQHDCINKAIRLVIEDELKANLPKDKKVSKRRS